MRRNLGNLGRPVRLGVPHISASEIQLTRGWAILWRQAALAVGARYCSCPLPDAEVFPQKALPVFLGRVHRRRVRKAASTAFDLSHWPDFLRCLQSYPRRYPSPVGIGLGRCWVSFYIHVALHRLGQLRIHLVRDRHDIRQQRTEVQSSQILLQHPEEGYLEYS